MRNRRSVSAVFAAVVTAAISAACTDSDRTTPLMPAQFDSLQTPAVMAVAVQPIPLFRRSIRGARCPFRQPFFIPFDLLVRSSGDTLFLNQVRMQFVDSFGTAGPQLTIPQPDLAIRFRTTEIAPQGARSFPFSLEFGCATAPTGTLFVSVQTTGPRGGRNDGTVRVAVR